MAILQIHDLPDDLYAELKHAAARNHRSISQEAIAQLRRAQGLDTSKRHAVIERLRTSPSLFRLTKGMRTPEELIREDRER